MCIFQGIVSEDLLGIIRILIMKKWFSVDEYNQKLSKFTYKNNERNDKPKNIPSKRTVKKLQGKAMSIWTHLRVFPFIIRNFVKDYQEPALLLALELLELVERITAPEFR